MSISRALLNKSEELIEEAYVEESKPKAYAKAFGAGVIEGFVDSAVVIGGAVIGLGWYLIIKDKFGRKN